MKKRLVIEVEEIDGVMSVTRESTGFNVFELLGLIESTRVELLTTHASLVKVSTKKSDGKK